MGVGFGEMGVVFGGSQTSSRSPPPAPVSVGGVEMMQTAFWCVWGAGVMVGLGVRGLVEGVGRQVTLAVLSGLERDSRSKGAMARISGFLITLPTWPSAVMAPSRT